MAQTTIISSITRSNTYPESISVTAPSNCGMLSIVLDNWTEQMICELPTINVKAFIDQDTVFCSFDIDLRTVKDYESKNPTDPYTIPVYDIPASCLLSVTPIFDNNALTSHNNVLENGNIEFFETSDSGIVQTETVQNNLYWNTPTSSFNVSITFDNSNIKSGGSGGGTTPSSASDITFNPSGTSLTSTNVQSAINETLQIKQDNIPDLSAIREGALKGSTSLQPSDIDEVPTLNSQNPVSSGGTFNYVNSSVATNTAYFIGTFSSLQELENYVGTVTNNDYAFVTSTDSSGNTLYNRYKYNGTTNTWMFEYALNNSSFTAAQWATIQSGLTSADKTKLNGIEAGANKTVVDSSLSNTSLNPVQNKIITEALNEKQNNLTFDNVPTLNSNNPVTSGGIYTDQQQQNLEIDYAINTGAKNIVNNTADATRTISGVEWTKNSDGSMTARNTSSGVSAVRVVGVQGSSTYASAVPIPRGTYTVSASGFDVTKYRFALGLFKDENTAREVINVYNEPYTFTVTSDTARYDFSCVIALSGEAMSGQTWYPMIRPSVISSPTYEPYAPTNYELYNQLYLLQSTLTPITQTEYDSLVDKTLPMYFVYEE